MKERPERLSRPRRWRTRLFLVVLGLLAGGLFAVLLLPSLLSSDWFRARLERQASQSLHRPVHVGEFRLSWSGILALSKLEIADDPAFSSAPLLALRRLEVEVDPWSALRGYLRLRVELAGLDARFLRTAAGRSNLEALWAAVAPPGRPPSASPDESVSPAAIPLAAASIRVSLHDISLRVEDRVQNRTALVHDAALDVDLPSLDAPVTASLRAGLTLDGAELPPLRFDLRAERWLGADRTVNLPGLLAEASGRLPGVDLELQADLARSRASGSMKLDLAALLGFARPFLPPEVAGSHCAGTLDLELEGKGRPGEPVSFALAMRGDGVSVSGPLLQGKSVGPMALGFDAKGQADPRAGSLAVERGELRVQTGTRVAWSSQMVGLGTPEAEFAVNLGPAALDLRELVALAVPFLPGDARISCERSTLGFEHASAAGPVPTSGSSSARHNLAVDGLVLALGTLRAERGGTAVEGQGLALGVERLEAELVDFFPRRMNLRVSLRADRFSTRGPQEVSVDGLEIPALRVSLEDLRQVPGQSGLAGRGNIEESMTVAALHSPTVGAVHELRQAARLAFTSGDGGKLKAEVADLHVSAARAEVAQPALDAALSGADLRVGKVVLTGPLLDAAPLAGQVPLTVEGLRLGVAEARARTGRAEGGGAGLVLSLQTLSAALRDGFPRDATLRASLGAERLEVAGAASARVAGLRVPDLEVRATGLAQVDGALFGVAGRVALRQALTAESLRAEPHGEVGGLRQSLQLDAELGRGPEVRVSAGALEFEAADARARVPDRGELRTPLRAAARWESARLAGPGELWVDVEGLRVDAAAAEWLRVDLAATAQASGRESVTTRGSVTVDLPGALRALPVGLWPGRAVGKVRANWAFDGRVPSDEELRDLTADPAALAAGRPLAFLQEAAASLSLDGVGTEVPLEGGQRVSVAGISTQEPLAFDLRGSGREVALGGALALGWIEAFPGLGEFPEPLRVRLSFHGERGTEGVLRVSESLTVEPLSVSQGLEVTVAGLDRLLRRGLDTAPALWLNLLSGQARANLRVGETPDLGLVTRELVLKGPLEAAVGVSLTRGEEVSGALTLLADGARVRLRDRLSLEGLRADVALEKRYRLRTPPAGGAAGASFLSETLVRPETAGRSLSASLLGPVRFGGTSTLGFDSLRATGGPVPVEVTGLEAAFSLPGGLPSVDRFALGTLGGFLVGSLEVARPAEGPGFVLGTRATFTGLDAARLVPGAAPRPGEDTELSGRFSLQLPLATELPAVLAAAEVDAELTHVGSRVLDRALYALDPTESNEAVVKQRRLVRLGGPRWIRVGVRHGNLSLAGEVEAAGIRIQLPRLERFNVASVPGVEAFGGSLASLGPVIRALEALSAETLEIDDAGAVRFRQGGEP